MNILLKELVQGFPLISVNGLSSDFVSSKAVIVLFDKVGQYSICITLSITVDFNHIRMLFHNLLH